MADCWLVLVVVELHQIDGGRARLLVTFATGFRGKMDGPIRTVKDRNVIERCYCRLKDFRRIATRYDKLARNYFSALCLVAAVAFWL